MQICQPQLPFAILLWVVCSWLDGFPTDARFLGCVCYAPHQLKIILAKCDYFISIFYLLVRIGLIPWQILFNWIVRFQIYGHWPKSLLFSCWLQWYILWLELEHDTLPCRISTIPVLINFKKMGPPPTAYLVGCFYSFFNFWS